MGEKKRPADKAWDDHVSGTPSEVRKIQRGRLIIEPGDYYDDPIYKKYQLRLRRMREAYKERRQKEMEERESETMHFEELPRLRRVIGSLKGITKMLEKGEPKDCRQVAYQLKGASTVLRKMAFHVLKRHFSCINKKHYPDDKTRINEQHLTLKAITELIEELRAISKQFGNREKLDMMDKLDEMSQEIFRELMDTNFLEYVQNVEEVEKPRKKGN